MRMETNEEKKRMPKQKWLMYMPKKRGRRKTTTKTHTHTHTPREMIFFCLHHLHFIPREHFLLGKREGSESNRFTMMHPLWICLLWNVICEVTISLATSSYSCFFHFFFPPSLFLSQITLHGDDDDDDEDPVEVHAISSRTTHLKHQNREKVIAHYYSSHSLKL